MKSTFDKNAEKFVNLMVEKIESLSMNWQKPWFSKVNSKQNFLPQNLTGRTYSGGNAFLLYFLCEKYKLNLNQHPSHPVQSRPIILRPGIMDRRFHVVVV